MQTTDRRGFLEAALGVAVATLTMPQASAAQELATSKSYGDALKDVTGVLDREATVGHYQVKVATTLKTSAEVDALALGLISSTGAPLYLANMPSNFSEVRLARMQDSSVKAFGIPYLNHENSAHPKYSVRAQKLRDTVELVAASQEMKKVLGFTPLDHQNAVYAIAVEKNDGNHAWIVAQITSGHTTADKNGKGPAPEDLHAVLPAMIGMTAKK